MNSHQSWDKVLTLAGFLVGLVIGRELGNPVIFCVWVQYNNSNGGDRNGSERLKKQDGGFGRIYLFQI